MVFNIAPEVVVLLGFLILGWLCILSFLLFRAISSYNRLTQGVSQQTLSELLNTFITQNVHTQQKQQAILAEIKKLRMESLGAIQKVGFVRFNPFADTGGDQSFALVLLDGNNTGVILTSLYGRSSVRWYLKTIKAGKAQDLALSKEEEQALKKVSK
jgi:hypothetical protein